jgi:hypothetical protein
LPTKPCPGAAFCIPDGSVIPSPLEAEGVAIQASRGRLDKAGRGCTPAVMAGLVPAHPRSAASETSSGSAANGRKGLRNRAFLTSQLARGRSLRRNAWMAGTSPARTPTVSAVRVVAFYIDSESFAEVGWI